MALKKLLLSQSDISRIDQLKISYALELFRNEGIKTILFFVFFTATGHLPEFLVCTAISCTVRIFAGGIHMKTNIGCFIMSFILLSSEILLLPEIPMPTVGYLSMLWASVAVICFLAPIPSYKRPFKTSERYNHCRKRSIIFSLIWGITLSLLSGFPYLQHCGIWYMLLQAIQMMMQTAHRRYFKK